MRPVGKPLTVDFDKSRIHEYFSVDVDDKGNVKIPELLDDLAVGVVEFINHHKYVDEHLKDAKQYVEDRKARADATAKDYARRAGSDH
jgi:hypothetical protein